MHMDTLFNVNYSSRNSLSLWIKNIILCLQIMSLKPSTQGHSVYKISLKRVKGMELLPKESWFLMSICHWPYYLYLYTPYFTYYPCRKWKSSAQISKFFNFKTFESLLLWMGAGILFSHEPFPFTLIKTYIFDSEIIVELGSNWLFNCFINCKVPFQEKKKNCHKAKANLEVWKVASN